MKKRTKFYALLFAMVLSLTQIIGVAVPVKAAEKKCSHGYTLSGDFGISRHEIAGGVCIECYHGHSKRVVIPRTFKLNGETLETWQISSNCGFQENGVKEIVLPDNSVYVEEYDKEFDEEFGYVAFKGITFYVHKGTPAEKSIKRAKNTSTIKSNTH